MVLGRSVWSGGPEKGFLAVRNIFPGSLGHTDRPPNHDILVDGGGTSVSLTLAAILVAEQRGYHRGSIPPLERDCF